MEMVDILDEKLAIVGQVTKDQAHQEGLLHTCVVAEVIDSTGRWTLVKQAADRQDAGQLVSPIGGHVSAGESIEAALQREAFEEMGLQNFQYQRVGQSIFNREVIGRKENHLFVLFEIYTDQPPTLNHESVSCVQFSLPELKQALKTQPLQFGEAFWFLVNGIYQPILGI